MRSKPGSALRPGAGICWEEREANACAGALAYLRRCDRPTHRQQPAPVEDIIINMSLAVYVAGLPFA